MLLAKHSNCFCVGLRLVQKVLQEVRSRAQHDGLGRFQEGIRGESHPVAEARLAVQQRQLPVRAVQADEKGKLKVHTF